MKVLLLVLIAANLLSAQEVIKLDLRKSLELANKYNHDLKIASLNRNIAEEKVSEAWGSALFPKISGSVDYRRALKRGVIIIDAPEIGFSGQFPQGTENTLTVGATLEQPLFTGAVFLAIRVANIFKEITDKIYDATKSELDVNVKKAYYSLLLTKEVLDLTKLNLKLAEDNLRNSESMYKAGVISEYDYIRAKVQVQNLIPEVQQAENSLILSENMLKLVTGIDLSQEIVVEDSLTLQEKSIEAYSQLTDELLLRNHTLKQLELQVDLQQDAASFEFTKHFPELYFTGSWQAQAQENDPRPFSEWRYKNAVYIGLNLKVPIFNGFQTTSKVDQAKIEVLKAKEEFEKSKKFLKNSLRDVVLTIDQTWKKIDAYQSTIEEAELGYDIAVKRFKSGVGTQLEVVDALVSLSRSKVNYYTGVYDYFILHAQLDQLLAEDSL